MKYRNFGKMGTLVSEIGFGCLRLAGTSTEGKNEVEVLNTISEALDHGVNFFDTADIYGQGGSEKILGKALRGRRTKVIIATKAGYNLTRVGRGAAVLKPLLRPFVRRLSSLNRSVSQLRASEMQQDFSPQYLAKAIDHSLIRLRTDYIDLFQLHNPSLSILESGEFLEAVEQAKAQGKIRGYGISCRAAQDAQSCFLYSSNAAIQIPMNLLNIEAAGSIVAEAQKRGVAVIAREPFASGSMFNVMNFSSGSGVTHDRGAPTQAQAALKALLRFPEISVVIPGMSTRAHLRENIAALDGSAAEASKRI
jgi:aryl-alcohol dehydrogenase-like predicted oxidoreductase